MRHLHSSASRPVQRLLWAGSVLDRTSSSLQEVPKDWLLSLGVQADVEQVRKFVCVRIMGTDCVCGQGISFSHLAASPSHSLLSYTTLPPSLPFATSDDGAGKPRTNPSGLQKVLSVGRNTYGELGLGFSSQESTWGMVTSGFEGRGGIKALQCGMGSSWMATAEDSSADCECFMWHSRRLSAHSNVGFLPAQSLLYAFGSE